MQNVIIIGGGASGMMAAINASRNHNKVKLIERNNRVGKKLIATGNGRCNLTNINTKRKDFYGNDTTIVDKVMQNFSVKDTINFFENLGISCKEEEKGKIFPNSDQASSVVDLMRYEMEKLGVEEITGEICLDISKKDGKFIVKTSKNKYTSDKVIITTGGISWVNPEKKYTGYYFAEKFGHKITNLFPSLVQLTLKGKYFKRIDGVKIYSKISLTDENSRQIISDTSDILFTKYGVSGPSVLQISRLAMERLEKNKRSYVNIHIIDKTQDGIEKILKNRILISPEKSSEFFMVGLINKRLIPVILLESNIDDMKKEAGKLKEKEIKNISKTLNSLRYEISGSRGFGEAKVTAGGIITDEIDHNTLESKKVKGLYFAGEVIDIDGKTGGYNLQWCWSTGYIASLLS